MLRNWLLHIYLITAGIHAASGFTHGFTTPNQIQTPLTSSTSLQAKVTNTNMDRSYFLKQAACFTTAFGFTATQSTPAWAKEIDPAIKGTKADPKYQACVSECIYECTKPKGDEQKSRAECIPECKKKCATSKAQLMVGTPVNKE